MAFKGNKRLEYFDCCPQEDRLNWLVRSARHGFLMISGMKWLKDHRFENCHRKGPYVLVDQHSFSGAAYKKRKVS